MTRNTQLALVLLAAALVAGGGAAATIGFGGAVAQQGQAAVTIEDQASDGQTVVVDSVTLSEGGFVVIHDESLEDGDAVESVVGVSRYLEAGTHENVPVTVAPEFDSATDVEVTAMAHRDTNGNQVFDFVVAEGGVDGPYTTSADGQETETPTATETTTETETMEGTETPEGTESPTGTETETPTETGTETPTDGGDGGPVVDTAVIDASGNQVPPTNLVFEDQSGNGTSVTVQHVTLYRGGYVVVHDESLTEGDAIGSVVGHSDYLPPGTYEDVRVTLTEPINASNESNANVTLIAMPHFETNQNLVYDFVTSLGTEDGPYLDENGSAVVAAASVTAAEEVTETPTETATPTETTEGTETPTEGMTETTTEGGGAAGTPETTEGTTETG